MKPLILAAAVSTLLSLWASVPAMALDGEAYIHDPSTVMRCDGKFYTFGTGGGARSGPRRTQRSGYSAATVEGWLARCW